MLADNVNRSASEVRTAITKSGGKVADPGSVLFNFQRQGLVMVAPKEDEDRVGAQLPKCCAAQRSAAGHPTEMGLGSLGAPA